MKIKVRKYLHHYTQHLDPLRAELECGYTVDLSKQEIREYLSKVLKVSEVPDSTRDTLLLRLHAILCADVTSYFEDDGTLKHLSKLTPLQKMAIKKWDVDRNTIEMHSITEVSKILTTFDLKDSGALQKLVVEYVSDNTKNTKKNANK